MFLIYKNLNHILSGLHSPWSSVSSSRLHNQPFRNIRLNVAFRKYLSKLFNNIHQAKLNPKSAVFLFLRFMNQHLTNFLQPF